MPWCGIAAPVAESNCTSLKLRAPEYNANDGGQAERPAPESTITRVGVVAAALSCSRRAVINQRIAINQATRDDDESLLDGAGAAAAKYIGSPASAAAAAVGARNVVSGTGGGASSVIKALAVRDLLGQSRL